MLDGVGDVREAHRDMINHEAETLPFAKSAVEVADENEAVYGGLKNDEGFSLYFQFLPHSTKCATAVPVVPPLPANSCEMFRENLCAHKPQSYTGWMTCTGGWHGTSVPKWLKWLETLGKAVPAA